MRALRRYLGARVVLQVGEQSIDGILESAEREVVTLVEARMLLPAETMNIDGRTVVPSASIRWAQVA